MWWESARRSAGRVWQKAYKVFKPVIDPIKHFVGRFTETKIKLSYFAEMQAVEIFAINERRANIAKRQGREFRPIRKLQPSPPYTIVRLPDPAVGDAFDTARVDLPPVNRPPKSGPTTSGAAAGDVGQARSARSKQGAAAAEFPPPRSGSLCPAAVSAPRHSVLAPCRLSISTESSRASIIFRPCRAAAISAPVSPPRCRTITANSRSAATPTSVTMTSSVISVIIRII